MLLDCIDGITQLMKSLLFHAHSRLPPTSLSAASNSSRGTAPPACAHDSDSRAALSGVDVLHFVLQACCQKLTAERATSLISTVFTEVEKSVAQLVRQRVFSCITALAIHHFESAVGELLDFPDLSASILGAL